MKHVELLSEKMNQQGICNFQVEEDGSLKLLSKGCIAIFSNVKDTTFSVSSVGAKDCLKRIEDILPSEKNPMPVENGI